MSNRKSRRPATPATATPAKSTTTRAPRGHRTRRIVVLPTPTPEAVAALPAPQAATDADRTDAIEATATTADTAQEATTAPQAATEQLPPAQVIAVPVNVLSALLAIAPQKDESRYYLQGVHVQQLGGELRLTATDGSRLLVVTQACTDSIAWAAVEHGAIIPAAELARITKFAGKDATVGISYGVGHPAAEIVADFGTFKVRPIDGKFPDITRLLADAGDALSATREPLQASAINAKFLKSAGVVSAALGSDGLFCFAPADEAKATVFTFASVPGALLLVMPMRANVDAIQAGTVRLIGQAGMASSIAALKAHETRNRKAAKDARSKAEAERLTKAADGYRERIEAIMAGLKPALPAPAPAATDEQADAA